jgi:phage shock protein E
MWKALIGLGLIMTLIAGCGGAPTRVPTDPPSAPAAVPQLDPAQFAAVLEGEQTFVLNVHVPDEGSIAGTDSTIPFDRLEARAAELPTDPATPIAVYCRSGTMSAIAVGTLTELGYQDVTELRGGMIAWAESGRQLLPPTG